MAHIEATVRAVVGMTLETIGTQEGQSNTIIKCQGSHFQGEIAALGGI